MNYPTNILQLIVDFREMCLRVAKDAAHKSGYTNVHTTGITFYNDKVVVTITHGINHRHTDSIHLDELALGIIDESNEQ